MRRSCARIRGARARRRGSCPPSSRGALRLWPDAGAELGRVREAWRRGRDGRGRVVLVTGVRGIGKTRLIGELAGELHARRALGVVYVGGTAPAVMSAAALDSARRATEPGLLVFDDLDRASDLIVRRCRGLAAGARERYAAGGTGLPRRPAVRAVGRLARELERAWRRAARTASARRGRRARDRRPVRGERAASARRFERLLEAGGGLPGAIHECRRRLDAP